MMSSSMKHSQWTQSQSAAGSLQEHRRIPFQPIATVRHSIRNTLHQRPDGWNWSENVAQREIMDFIKEAVRCTYFDQALSPFLAHWLNWSSIRYCGASSQMRPRRPPASCGKPTVNSHASVLKVLYIVMKSTYLWPLFTWGCILKSNSRVWS